MSVLLSMMKLSFRKYILNNPSLTFVHLIRSSVLLHLYTPPIHLLPHLLPPYPTEVAVYLLYHKTSFSAPQSYSSQSSPGTKPPTSVEGFYLESYLVAFYMKSGFVMVSLLTWRVKLWHSLGLTGVIYRRSISPLDLLQELHRFI